MERSRSNERSSALLIIDLGVLAGSYLLSVFLLTEVFPLLLSYGDAAMREYVLVLGLSFAIASFLQPQSRKSIRRDVVEECVSVLRFAVLLFALFAVLLVLFKSPVLDSRYLFVVLFLCFCVGGCVSHVLYRAVKRRKGGASLIEIVTTPERATETIRAVQDDVQRSIVGVWLVGDVEQMPDLCGCTCLGQIKDAETLVQSVTHEALDEILFCLPYASLETLSEEIAQIESAGTVVHLYLTMLDRYAGTEKSVTMLGGCPAITMTAKTHAPEQLAIKRLFDIVVSAVGLVVSAPILLLFAIPLLIESPGPLFFSQIRIGRNGRPFRIYKLRSMYVDAEARKQELLDQNEMSGLMFKIEKDPRITKVGRIIRATSIDELPQFFNVLKGDMSLIGTRPPLTDEFEQYLAHYKRRLSMRPGITGLWQVSGRNQVFDFEEVVRMDLAYIDNWSLLLDLKILLRTVLVVLKCTGR